jgi:hypothetical protein
MPFYKDHVYPNLVSVLGNPKPIEDIRRRIVPLAQGNVLEIGVGPGVNFIHYDPAKVGRVYALDPTAGCFGVQKSNGAELNWISSFSICPENTFLWQMKASIQS